MIRGLASLLRALVFTTCAFTPGLAVSASLDSGLRAYDRQDYRTAYRVLKPHAEAGEPEAQLTIGRMFANGDGVLQDYVEAHRWLNLAASGGLRRARIQREATAQKMTPRQIARAQSLARNFQPSAIAAPTAKPHRPAPRGHAQPEDITGDVQKMLAALGYDPGPADGVAGDKTRSAIRTYQGHSGLAENGEISIGLYNTLAADLGRLPLAETDSHPRSSGTEHTSSTPSASASTDGNGLREALDEVSALAREAEKERSADWRVIRAMRDIVARYGAEVNAAFPHQPASARVLYDAFSDGNFDRQPAWRVRSGRFWIDQRKRLRSDVEVTPKGAPKELSNDQIPLAILGALLGQPSGGETPHNAVIEVAAQIPAAHEIRTGFSAGEGPSELQLSLLDDNHQSAKRTLSIALSGKRATLSLRGAEGEPLDQVTLATQDDERRIQTLAWRTDHNGRTQVSVNGQPILNPWSPLRRATFSGLRLTNVRGRFAVDYVEVKRLSGS